jgi:two-component system, sensor histidine kinase and response regulator
VSAYMKKRFDMVLLDIQMPRMDGPEALRLIRAHERTSKLTSALVIMITGVSTEETKELCYNAGADGFYVKPLSLKNIDQVLETHFVRDG